jgi:hypothetical protein
MTMTPNPTFPPLDPAQLAELARFFHTFGEWLRGQVRETEEIAAMREPEAVPEGMRSVTFFDDELVANLDDFALASARLLAMADSRPVAVRRLDFSTLAPSRPGLRLATVDGKPAAFLATDRKRVPPPAA